MSKHHHPLRLYTCFHLNLAFSSIEGRERRRVLEQCYWPLLSLIERCEIPTGIEVSASTLEMIEEMDPAWIAKMRELIKAGLVDFIGSGFVQLIAPLVPAEVNRHNFRIGNQIYEEMLGTRPKIALVHEQAYSPGVVPLYKEAGYEAIIMDWANPFTNHSEWEPEWVYTPQKIRGVDGVSLDILWNDSIPFQKFQRYVYGETSLDQHLMYLETHLAEGQRAFPLYGSDAEVFNFRPGRYAHEENIDTDEWMRVEHLFRALDAEKRFAFSTPSDVLAMVPNGKQVLSLESPADPIPVKKQPKYNITRWAVSGRDDLCANTACWRVYKQAQRSGDITDNTWRNICLKWRSDYRTHITETRWNIYCWDMSDSFRKDTAVRHHTSHAEWLSLDDEALEGMDLGNFTLTKHGHFVTIKSRHSKGVLNLKRGMAVHEFCVPELGPDMVFGTLPHGYFSDINWSADYYSAHLVAELAGRPKVCDLELVHPEICYDAGTDQLSIRAEISTPLGLIRKLLRFHGDEPQMDMRFELDWHNTPPSNLRLAHITLNPNLFDRGTLFYETHNGGDVPEHHSLARVDVDHGAAVSFSTSAQSGLGMTEGTLLLGDRNRAVELSVNKEAAAMIGMVTCRKVNGKYFCRASLSARELDDTFRTDGPFIALPDRNLFECSVKVLDRSS